ncbi:armadillo-type protein [Schizophyllum commune]
MDQNFVNGLHQLLLQATGQQNPDTSLIKAATAQLNTQYYKNEACIPALAQILASSLDQAVRQLAAVELRKRIINNDGAMWLLVPSAQRDEIKQKMLEIVGTETSKPVRHQAARATAGIASIEVAQYGQLFPFVMNSCAPTSPAPLRETGAFLLYSVLDSVDVYAVKGDLIAQLYGLLDQLLVDPENAEVRVLAVRILGILAQYLDVDDKEEMAHFQTLLPKMLQVIGQAVESGDDSVARQLFDTLETLLILEVPLLTPIIPDLVKFLLTCGSDRKYEPEVRALALNALNWCIQYKKSKIQSYGLGPAIMEGLMIITTEDEPEDSDEESPSRSALRIIDSLSTNLPPSQVYPALREQMGKYLSSPDAAYRKGALMALGVAVEGCSDYMSSNNHMEEIWPAVELGLQDKDAKVRKAACIAVSCLCQWLEDNCIEKHAVLVPAMMDLINDPETQAAACTALDSLLEILTSVIDQYLPLIMDRLASLLTAPNVPGRVKSVVTGAIGSAAHAAKERFLPYFDGTMSQLRQFASLGSQAVALGSHSVDTIDAGDLELRGIAMDAIGTIAEAVGKEKFRPWFPEMMQRAVEGAQMLNGAAGGRNSLRECSFLFFGVMARVFGEEFAQYLEGTVKMLLDSLSQDESALDVEEGTVSVADAANAFNAGTSPSTAISVSDGMGGEEETDIKDLEKLLETNSAVAIEKEIAADSIGTLFAATRGHFLPYVEQCTMELTELCNHYYEGVRKSAVDSLLEIVRTFFDISQESPEGSAAQHTKDLVKHIMPQLIEMFESEDNKSVASGLCVALAETINKMGEFFTEGYEEQLCKIAIVILEQKAYCQTDPDQDESEEAPEDSAELEGVLIGSACDLVSSMAIALGEKFQAAFQTFFPLITKYYKKTRSLTERSSAIGCLSEIIGGMEGSITPFTEPLMELFHRALHDSEPEVQGNAAFAVGLLVQHSQMDLSAQVVPILAALRPLFDSPSDAPAPRLHARDNAAGAVGRMISRNTAAVPLDQVLPVWIQSLPLKNDFQENAPVYRALFHLFRTNSAALQPYLDHLLQIFAYVLDPERTGEHLTEDVRSDMLQLIKALNAEIPDKVQAAGLGPFA